MKSSNLLVLLLLFFFGGTLHAQTVDEQKKQIASVKKSNLYIYGEATAETEQDARDLAEEILNYEINKWAASQKKLKGTANFVLNNRQELYTTMSLPRGNMFRSFMYVKKSDIQKCNHYFQGSKCSCSRCGYFSSSDFSGGGDFNRSNNISCCCGRIGSLDTIYRCGS